MEAVSGRRPVILLDLDDTILDFRRAEAVAIARTFRELGLPDGEETIRRYSEINRQQWALMEEGRLSREQVLLRRFTLLFEELGTNASAARARDRYESLLARGHWFIPGAKELLEELREDYDLYLASNGTASVQAGRIESAGIAPCFREIFVSEELGANKPERAFFEACFARIPDFDRERCLMLGDGLGSDIRGGIRAGIRTCWFNPAGLPGRADIVPDHEIRELRELPPLLKRIWS